MSAVRLQIRSLGVDIPAVHQLFHCFIVGPAVAVRRTQMEAKAKTMIVTGASKGIGAGVTKEFLKRGYNVVANSLHVSQSALEPSEKLVLVEGDVADSAIATQIAAT